MLGNGMAIKYGKVNDETHTFVKSIQPARVEPNMGLDWPVRFLWDIRNKAQPRRPVDVAAQSIGCPEKRRTP